MNTFTIASNQGTMGGGEVMMLAIAEAARELGRDVTIVAPQTPGDVVAEARKRGFRVIAIHGDTTVKYLENLRRWDARERTGLLGATGCARPSPPRGTPTGSSTCISGHSASCAPWPSWPVTGLWQRSFPRRQWLRQSSMLG